MISPEETGYTIQPLSRLSLMLEIARCREVGFDHFANALVKLYMQLYPEDIK